MSKRVNSSKIEQLLFPSPSLSAVEQSILFTRGTPIFSSLFPPAKSHGLGQSLPKLLKTGVALALACAALGQAPKEAQAQTKLAQAPLLQFGVAMVGPAPIRDTPLPDICWAPGTSAATIAEFERREIDSPFQISPYRVIGQGRWTRTATDGGGLMQGQPTTIRYSIVPDGTAIPGFGNEAAAPSNLQARLTSIYGSKTAWLTLFARVGAALSAQSGLNYIYEPNDDGAAFGPVGNGDQSPGVIGTRGDVRVSGHRIDGDSNRLAYNFEPAGGGDMVIDTADNFYENRRDDDLGFRNVITHEFGHGVGLAHTCPLSETKLMEPLVSYDFDGPQLDDIRGLQRFYGDSLEDNDTAATATNLGALNNGTTNAAPGKTLSIDNTSDSDYFRFSTPANKSISITVRPVGDAYLEGPQNADGSCSAGTNLDPKTINDLGFELLQSDAAGNFTSVASVNANPAGGTETLVPTNFPAGGNFRVRVFGGNVADVQTYTMDVTVGAPVVTPTPVPDPTAGPEPTPVPTPTAGPTPLPGPTAIRPIVDLNGLNADEAAGEDSPNPSGIDNTSIYQFRILTGGAIAGIGGPQFITPDEAIIFSDISSTPVIPGSAIAEARVELTPDDSCIIRTDQTTIPDGIAPDNCNPQGKRDNEVLAIPAQALTNLNNAFRQNLSAAYDVNTQILTIRGGQRSNREIRAAYQAVLQLVTYENKLPIDAPNQPFRRTPNLRDRVITYVVDTDTDETNNRDGRFVPQDPGNPKQSKPATLILRFVDSPSLVVTTLSDASTDTDQLNSLREAINFANSTPAFNNANPPVANPPSIITFAPDLATAQRPGTINLLSPLPPLNGGAAIAVQGPGARILTINGSRAGSSVFTNFGSSTISGLRITGGTGNTGGGILNNGGSLTVNASTISGNSAGVGGGVGTVGGAFTLTNSTISGNAGGGLYLNNFSGGDTGQLTTTLTNSTISGNTGEGISHVAGTVTTSLVTITNNSAAGYALSGNNSSVAQVGSTIISDNANNDVTTTGRTYTSRGYNLVGTGNAANAANFGAAGDQINPAGGARLSVLANNGGPTNTHNLLSGSPAINNGGAAGGTAPAGQPATDQRGEGFPRVALGNIDIGALEKQNNDAVVNPIITPRNPTTNQTITVNANTDAPANSLNYEFFVNGTSVQSGNSNTLDLSVPGQGDLGDTVSVRVTADNGSGVVVAGTDSVVVTNRPTFTTTISATNPAPNAGSTEVLTNSLLRANIAVTNPNNDGFTATYQWSVNGVAIPGERGQTLDLSKAGNGDRGDVVSVRVTITDNSSGDQVVQTASVTVGNTAPIAAPVTFNVASGQTVRIALSATDVDTKQPTQAKPNGVDRFFRFDITTAPTKGTATIATNADGSSVLVYTAGATATGADTLQFTATDTTTFANGTLTTGAGSRTSAPATATINITSTTPTPTPPPAPTPTPVPTPAPTPSNRPPSGSNFSVKTQREVPFVARIALSDPDPEDTYNTLRVVRVGGLKKGTGGIRKDTDGVWKLFYKASRLYQGDDFCQYVVIDSKGAQSAPFTITINILNTKPTARSTKMQVAAGGSASVAIFGQDADNDTLTFQRVGGPTKGTGEIRRDTDGVVRFFYQNDPAAVGNDEVRFVAVDGNAGGISDIATIEITVVGVFNRAPSAQNVAGTTTANTPVAVAVAATDPDEGDVLTFKRVGGPNNGSGEIRQDTDGTFKMFYTPRDGFTGTETIRYVAVDQKGRPSAPATITITVTASPSAASAIKSSPSAGSS